MDFIDYDWSVNGSNICSIFYVFSNQYVNPSTVGSYGFFRAEMKKEEAEFTISTLIAGSLSTGGQ